MPAGEPRSRTAATAAKTASQMVKRLGLRRLRSRVKRSAKVRQVLYRPYADDRPTPDPDTVARLRAGFAGEVADLDPLLGVSVSRRWGYEVPTDDSAVR
jgi:hypothetical protein